MPEQKITDNHKNGDVEQASKITKFSDYQLPEPLLATLNDMGFDSPTPVQKQTLNLALAGKDLMVSAQTGSGKTIAFLLPCLANVINRLPPEHSRHKKARPQVLVICPTRELVQQVFQDAVNLIKKTQGVRIASVVGGMSYPKQIAGLKGAQVVIATPGRLLDLQSKNNISLDYVTHLVLDEADRMLDLGFSEALAKIAQFSAKREQTLLFSATFADEIVRLGSKLMDDPQRIELANTQDKHADITQSLYWADDEVHKQALLMYWLRNEPIEQAVVFAPTKVETERLAFDLRKKGYDVIDLHGGMQQHLRMKQLKKLRNGKVKILVATDVAARGLDVPTISHVFNYGVPMKNEDYVHRIGRTGRAGKQGKAITVATHAERSRLIELQHFLEQTFDVHEVSGMEPKPYIAKRERNNRGGKAGGRNGKPRGNGKNGRNRGFDYDPTKAKGKAKRKKGKRFGAERADKFGEGFGKGKQHKKTAKPNLKRTNRNAKPMAKPAKRAGVKETVFGKSSKMVKGFKKGKPKR